MRGRVTGIGRAHTSSSFVDNCPFQGCLVDRCGDARESPRVGIHLFNWHFLGDIPLHARFGSGQ